MPLEIIYIVTIKCLPFSPSLLPLLGTMLKRRRGVDFHSENELKEGSDLCKVDLRCVFLANTIYTVIEPAEQYHFHLEAY